MANTPTGSSEVKTVRNMFEIVEQIRTMGEAGVTELADELGMAKSTVHGYLVTMEDVGYLVKEGGKYRLGLQFLDDGIYRRQQIVSWDIVGPTLRQLSSETEEIAWFSVEERGWIRDLYKSEGERAITVEAWLGQARPMHTLAAGKAILAHMPEKYVDWVIDTHGLEPETENTITSREAFLEELDRVRETGVAFNDEEYNRGIRSVGTPVIDEGEILGAVNVSGPANRMKGDRFREDLPQLLLGAANEIELKLQSIR